MIRCESAVAYIEKRLELLTHPTGRPVKLVQFTHDSPAMQVVRHHIAEALVNTLEQAFDMTPRNADTDTEPNV